MTTFLAFIILIVVSICAADRILRSAEDDVRRAENVVQVFSLSGHGSSSVAKALESRWNIQSGTFVEHDGPDPVSNALQSVSGGGTTIVNMKGFGPNGDNSDEASMNAIVKHAKEIGHINGLLLVVNGEEMMASSDIVTSSLTGLLQMYVDTFGSEMVNQLGVVITRSFLVDGEKIKHELNDLLSKLAGRPVHTPVWLVETRVERLHARSLPDSVVQEALNNLTVAAGEIKMWLEKQPALDVAHVVAAPHPHYRKESVGAPEKLQLDSDNYHKEWLKVMQWAAENNPHYRKVIEATEKLQLANEISRMEWLKAMQWTEGDLLRVAEEVRAFAAAEAKDSHEKAQVIAALSGDLGLSQYERVTILKTATFALSLVVPNASKGIDNVTKGSLKTGT